MKPVHRGMLAAELGLDEHDDVFEIDDGMLALRDLMDWRRSTIPRCTIRRTIRPTTRA